jgi:hypothetical protein
MIDHPEATERLLAQLEAALPIPARLAPELQASLRGQNAGTAIPASCQVTWVTHMGDEGGIVCKLDLGPDVEKEAFTSITHLRFDARLPLARDIAAYQKHRVKRLKRQHRWQRFAERRQAKLDVLASPRLLSSWRRCWSRSRPASRTPGSPRAWARRRRTR